jgi:hypothetical protein
MSGTALANFGTLANWSVTTSSGATCQMSLVGGSDSRNQVAFSNIDYGLTFQCPWGTLRANSAEGGTEPADSDDPLDSTSYPVLGPARVGCRNGSIYPDLNEKDSCYTTGTYRWGIPGHRYAVHGHYELWLNSGDSWTSFPSWCYTSLNPEGLDCYPDAALVTGF